MLFERDNTTSHILNAITVFIRWLYSFIIINIKMLIELFSKHELFSSENPLQVLIFFHSFSMNKA